MAKHGLPPAAYISGDTPIYQQTARYEGVYNRALIYRGYTLHSGVIPADLDFSADPSIGRLTANTFLRGEN